MSQAERHDKQAQRAGAAVAEQLRQRQALAPRPIAVRVAAAFGYMQPAWRLRSFSELALRGSRR